MTTTEGVTSLITATICSCSASAAEPDEASVVDGDELAAGSTAGTLAASVAVAAVVVLPAAELAVEPDAQPETITATSAKATIGLGTRRESRRMSNIISSSWKQPAWYHGGIQ